MALVGLGAGSWRQKKKSSLILMDTRHQLKGYPRMFVQDQNSYTSGRPSTMVARLLPVEGLRAYLALWVLADHVMWLTGYWKGELAGLFKLIASPAYAVDLFCIISGFVIVRLLDTQREPYLQFIVRRFFRLFPVFIVLFVIAIPLSYVDLWNMTHASSHLTPDQIEFHIDRIELAWENIQWNILLHLTMLHGVVPDVLVKAAPAAFLVPAWSISLEWQFYLVAPLAYAWAVSARPFRRIGGCALCLVLVLAASYVFPKVQFGAALPFHVQFFFLGGVSYFFYWYQATHQRPGDTAFPVACCLALMLFVLSHNERSLIPVGLWMVFLGLLLEHPSSTSSRLVGPLLTNPLVLYLGRISYSLYLSHFLVIILIQYALLTWAPHLSRIVHFGILLVCTIVVTIAVSTVLYRYVESPGIQAGRSLARWLAARRDVVAQDAITPPIR